MKTVNRKSFIFKNTRKEFFMSIRKLAAIMVIYVAILSSCDQQEEKQKEEKEKCQLEVISPGLTIIYLQPWIYDFVEECLDSGFHGRMHTCIYRDGFGFLAESYENTDTVYRFYDCEGMVLYEEKESPINSLPELKIESKGLVFGMYPPIWKEIFDELEGNVINPFTFSRAKEMVLAWSYAYSRSAKLISIFSHKNVIYFHLYWATNGINFVHSEYLDGNGNVLCTRNQITGERIPCNDNKGNAFEFAINQIDQDRKIILEFSLSYINF